MKRWALGSALAMAMGVLLAGSAVPVLMVAAFITAICVILLYRFHRKKGVGRYWMWLPVCLLIIGFLRHEWLLAEMNGRFARWDDQMVTLTGRVTDMPRTTSYGVVFPLSVNLLQIEGEQMVPGGRVRVVAYEIPATDISYGDTIRVSGRLRLPDGQRNPGGFDMAMYLAARGMGAQLTLEGEPAFAGSWRGSRVAAWGFRLRLGALEQLERFLPGEAAAVMAGMLLGETSSMDPDLRESFRIAGLSHIMAVSGANIAFLLLPLLWLLKRVGVNRRYASIAALPLLLLYVLMTGFDASIVRAALMALLMLAGRLFWRKTDMAASLSVAMVLMLLLNSAWLFDVGFQLSFLATAGIGLFCRPLSEGMPHWLPKWFRDTLAVTLSAQAAVLPVLSGTFHSLQLLSVPVNLLVVPLSGLLTLSGALLVTAGLALPVAGAGFGQLLGAAISLLCRFVTWTAQFPGAEMAVPSPPALLTFLYVGALLLTRFRKWLPNQVRGMAVPVTWLGCLIAGLLFLLPDGRLLVIIADVGQGDGLFIRTPSGYSLLVDGGGSPADTEGTRTGERIMLPLMRSQGVVRPDMLISTHPHLDHLQGLEAVARGAGTDVIVLPNGMSGYDGPGGLLETAEQRRIKVERVHAGDVIWEEPGLVLTVLSPEAGGVRGTDDMNEHSLVLRLEWRGFSMLMMGDAGNLAERQMIELSRLNPVDVLKVGHHGSRFATDSGFLEVVQPALSVVSAGRNRYGHPNPEVLDRLSESGSDVHLTIAEGALLLRTNGWHHAWEPHVKARRTVFSGVFSRNEHKE